MKTQRKSLVSLLRLPDEVTTIKQKVDDTLDMSGAVVASQKHPLTRIPGLGEEDVPVIFKPLLSSPKVPLVMDMGQLDLSNIEGLTLQQIEMIQEKAKARAKKYGKIAVRALRTYDGHFPIIISS